MIFYYNLFSKDKCGKIESEKDERDRFECNLFDDTVNYHYLDSLECCVQHYKYGINVKKPVNAIVLSYVYYYMLTCPLLIIAREHHAINHIHYI